ncbi:MAG: MFS transporter [Actinomycetota bacterium]|nr:MAG: MFS transporter [Actinomycetota bacterium]
MLALGMAAQTAGTVVVMAPAFLIPTLHIESGLSLAAAGLLASTPTLGMVTTLVAWGALTDRVGERGVITGGLVLTAVVAATAAAAANIGVVALGLAFLLCGMAAASSNAASGRVVIGWFPRDRRGLAMGIRQVAPLLGTALAAVTIPGLASRNGVAAALLLTAAIAAGVAVVCGLGLVDPPRAAAADGSVAQPNPYRANRFLLRVHTASVLLVFSQFTVSTFGLVWLISGIGWEPVAAGLVIAASQVVGAAGRIAIGAISDRIGSRVRLLRWTTAAASVVMLALAIVDATGGRLAGVALVVAATATVAGNGLAFTAVAEAAGPAWAGRALGIQNTGQAVAATAVGPLVGAAIGVLGYPLAFATVALFPALAVGVVPGYEQHA